MGVESDFIWMDGKLVPFAEANIHVLAHGLHYGLGVFEGIRAYQQPNGKPGIWRLRPHLRRLMESAKIMRVQTDWTLEAIETACLDTLDANKFSEAYLRPLIFTGMGSMGLGARNNPIHFMIAAWKWGAYVGQDAMDRGVRLKTSSFVRHHPNAAPQRAKVVGNYCNNILARYEAADDGYDEALMLDHQGFVAEGSGENIFVVREGLVLTPPEMNILPGITRTSVIDILRHEGIEVKEQLFGRDALYTADEAFMCGTAAEVSGIRELDKRPIGDGNQGPITKLVRDLYAKAVRGQVDWLARDITVRS